MYDCFEEDSRERVPAFENSGFWRERTIVFLVIDLSVF